MLSSALYAKYPTVYYNDQLATNITVRLKFKDIAEKNMAVFYPYTIVEGERPDTLAYKYYDDPTYAWLIFLANDMYDPTFDWPLTNEQLNRKIIDTYGSIAEAQETTLFYRVEWSSDDSLISQAAYNALPARNKKYWSPVLGTNNKITGFQRARVDWAIDTNKIVELQLLQSNADVTLEAGMRLYQITSGVVSAKGTISGFTASGHPMVNRVEGTFETSKDVYVKNSSTDSKFGTCTSATVTANNLDPTEENYWAPVSAYDTELELNESKKYIYLIDKVYLDAIEKDIRNLLAQ